MTSPVIDFFWERQRGAGARPVRALLQRWRTFGRGAALRAFRAVCYSVGSSFEGARLAGVRTTRIIMVTYIVCSVCAALAGIVTACRLYVGHPVAGSTAALDSIAAIVIGGTSLGRQGKRDRHGGGRIADDGGRKPAEPDRRAYVYPADR